MSNKEVLYSTWGALLHFFFFSFFNNYVLLFYISTVAENFQIDCYIYNYKKNPLSLFSTNGAYRQDRPIKKPAASI